MDLTARKLANAKRAGADLLCVICPFCQIQFERVQGMILRQRTAEDYLPSILFTQLLGLAMGIDGRTLGLNKNLFSPVALDRFNLSNLSCPTA
jgi:heterodisulfide reductase subunit B